MERDHGLAQRGSVAVGERRQLPPQRDAGYVEGRLESRSWEDKEGQKRYITEVVADDVILLGGRGGEARAAAATIEQRDRPVSMPRSAQRPPAPAAPAPEDFNQGITDDDVPF